MTPLLVSHYAVDEIFPKVAAYLHSALGTHIGWTLPDLHSACSSRNALLFVDEVEHPKAVMVARFEVWGGEQVLNCIAMGGAGGENWPEAMAHIKRFAALYGARAVVFHGRKGWQRVLPEAEVIYQSYRIRT